MREILFRGKRTYNGEWVEGLYVTGENNLNETKHMIKTKDDTCFVDPETIGQYTGLTDKNGKKIFEGDIFEDSNGRRAVIKFGNYTPNFIAQRDEMIGFYVEWINFEYYRNDFKFWFDEERVAIIGNTTDNPELLKGGGENG